MATVSALLLPVMLGLPAVTAQAALVAPVGQGFTVTPSDLSFILKQIKIAEAHVANTTSLTGPCGALVGTGPNQLASPLLSYGLRTVDGSCNNLQPGQETFGAADQVFPRLGSKSFRPAEGSPANFFGPGPAGPQTSYAQKKGLVFDSEPRTISNLIVDQTSTNPSAIAAAGKPVRTQGATGVVPCTTEPTATTAGIPVGCIPAHQTLFIPNVTTDVGLSPPYNSLFTIFGQFFDHGVDQTVKSGGTVFVPLKADDPLIPGPDHVLANAANVPRPPRARARHGAQRRVRGGRMSRAVQERGGGGRRRRKAAGCGRRCILVQAWVARWRLSRTGSGEVREKARANTRACTLGDIRAQHLELKICSCTCRDQGVVLFAANDQFYVAGFRVPPRAIGEFLRLPLNHGQIGSDTDCRHASH